MFCAVIIGCVMVPELMWLAEARSNYGVMTRVKLSGVLVPFVPINMQLGTTQSWSFEQCAFPV